MTQQAETTLHTVRYPGTDKRPLCELRHDWAKQVRDAGLRSGDREPFVYFDGDDTILEGHVHAPF